MVICVPYFFLMQKIISSRIVVRCCPSMISHVWSPFIVKITFQKTLYRDSNRIKAFLYYALPNEVLVGILVLRTSY